VKTIAQLVNKKIVQSGNIVEIYHYEKGYLKDYTKFDTDTPMGRQADYISDDYDINRDKVLKRAKRDLRRLINSNHGQYGKEFTSKFLTLTFKDNITDLTPANYEFKKFMKRLNYEIFDTKKMNLKYNVVVEFQERGAIHYHLIIYNIPYTRQKVIQELWGNGFVWINKIENVDNVGAYVAEYLGDREKGQGHNVEDDRLRGRKSYFGSRGLFKPYEITDKKKVEALSQALPVQKIVYSAQFDNEHLGHISYIQYNLNK
jgi:hypothetical protein